MKLLLFFSGGLMAGAIMGPFPAVAQSEPNCKPDLSGFDICEKARSMQQEMAAILPMRVNANMTWMQVMAIGPRLSLMVVWNLKAAEVTSQLASTGMTMESLQIKMQADTQSLVCSQPVTAAFVRLGGEVEYVYQTMDRVWLASPLVTHCAR